MDELLEILVLGAVLIGAIYGIDLLAARSDAAGWGDRTRRLTLLVIGSLAAFLLLVGAVLTVGSLGEGDEPGFGSLLLLSLGGTGVLVLWTPTRRFLARLLPFDAGSLRDALGLLAIVWVVALQLGAYFASDDGIDVGEGGIPIPALFAQAAVFIGVAFAAVGVFTRRTPGRAIERLGLRGLTTRSTLISVGLVIPILVAAALALVVTDAIRPGTSEELSDTLDQLTGEDPGLGIALAIALTASTGEELLFRGAIQPRYGMVFTALAWGLLHVQYDLMLNLLSLVPAGIILGLERRYLGTTACIVTHGVYNLLAVLNS